MALRAKGKTICRLERYRELQQGREEDKQVEHKQAASLSNFIDAYMPT